MAKPPPSKAPITTKKLENKRVLINFNLQIMEKNPEKYLETLNTFDGITLGYKCMHTEGVEPIKLQELYLFFFF